MQRSHRLLSLFVALNLLSISPVAFAQAKKPRTVGEELPADARREWNTGLTLVGESNWRGAIIQFQRAYDLSKNPRVLPNLALAHKGNADYARAIRVFEKALAEGASVIPAKEQQDIKDSIVALKPYVSTLSVTTSVAGASVNVDGEDVGVTPLAKPIDVSVGARTVRVSKDGFREVSRNVDVVAGKPAAVEIELVPERIMAVVSVTTSGAPKANIRIDGIEMGPAPYKGQVEVGKRHTFEAYANRYTTARQTLDVAKNDPFDVSLTLSEARNEGRIAIIVHPAGAIIDIDQETVGHDKWEGVLSAGGGHRVRFHKDGYVDEVQEISLGQDQVRTIESTLRQDTSRGTVYWAVGALLVVGGGVIAGLVLANQGRDSTATPGTFTPGLVTTWRH